MQEKKDPETHTHENKSDANCSTSRSTAPAIASGNGTSLLLDGSSFIFPVLRPSRVDLPREPEVIELQNRLSQLKLSNKAIEDRENARIASTKELLEKESRKGLRSAEFIRRSQTPWFVMLPYKLLCWLLGETRVSIGLWVNLVGGWLLSIPGYGIPGKWCEASRSSRSLRSP